MIFLRSLHRGYLLGIFLAVPIHASFALEFEPRTRFAINLFGAPPLSDKEYAAYRSKAGVETISAPTSYTHSGQDFGQVQALVMTTAGKIVSME